MRDDFWKVWRDSYLQSLINRSKWLESYRNIKINDIVLIKSELTPPSQWPLARVTKFHTGDDGLTRVVTLRTANSELVRSIVKLILLPIETDSNN